jgi:hypothetical protein
MASVVPETEHRDHVPVLEFPFNVCVARPVGKKEVQGNKVAQEAVLKEWTKLRNAGCWNEDGVQEWAEVRRKATASGTTVHVGNIFEIVVEKGAELPVGHPGRKFKGRVAFQGNRVKDQNYDQAMFAELGSCPATMEAGKAADTYGLFMGHTVEQADAEQAYVQAKLGGETPTWVRLPRDRWPLSWFKGRSVTGTPLYHDPVCPLILALYGHPDSGGYWEKHCETHLLSVGFEPIEDWRSCYFHPSLRLFLVVYVDDFKMSGPQKTISKGWSLIRAGVKTEDPTVTGKYPRLRARATHAQDALGPEPVRPR